MSEFYMYHYKLKVYVSEFLSASAREWLLSESRLNIFAPLTVTVIKRCSWTFVAVFPFLAMYMYIVYTRDHFKVHEHNCLTIQLGDFFRTRKYSHYGERFVLKKNVLQK